MAKSIAYANTVCHNICMTLVINNANDVLQFISSQVQNGSIQRGTGVSLKSTWRRVMQKVYGENWQAISINNIRADELGEKYDRMAAGQYGEETIRIDKSRVRRILKDARNAKAMLRAEQRFDDSVAELVRIMQMAQDMFLPELEEKVFRPEGKKEYDYFSMPIDAKKIIGLALPKGLSVEELDRTKKMLSGIFICEKVKRKGEV